MDELRDYRIVCMVDTVRNIARFKATFQQKKVIFDEIAKSQYYREFLSKGVTDAARVGLKRHYFTLFNARYYRLIILCERLYSMIRGLS
jgi:hypothetical protein